MPGKRFGPAAGFIKPPLAGKRSRLGDAVRNRVERNGSIFWWLELSSGKGRDVVGCSQRDKLTRAGDGEARPFARGTDLKIQTRGWKCLKFQSRVGDIQREQTNQHLIALQTTPRFRAIVAEPVGRQFLWQPFVGLQKVALHWECVNDHSQGATVIQRELLRVIEQFSRFLNELALNPRAGTGDQCFHFFQGRH